jgi:hypothetical protein
MLRRSEIGYLTADELQAAYRLLTPAKQRFETKAARTALEIVRRFGFILVLLGIGVAWDGASYVYDKWDLHQTLEAQRDKERERLPRRLNASTTLTDVSVGLTSLTRLYRVTVQQNKVDLPTFGANLRRLMCANEAAMIKRGASYDFEYRDIAGNLVGRFEISSCP